jgi:hypothetical protein
MDLRGNCAFRARDGYAMTVLEDITAPELFNLLQHVCSAVGAIAFVVAARAVYVEMTRPTEVTP